MSCCIVLKLSYVFFSLILLFVNLFFLIVIQCRQGNNRATKQSNRERNNDWRKGIHFNLCTTMLQKQLFSDILDFSFAKFFLVVHLKKKYTQYIHIRLFLIIKYGCLVIYRYTEDRKYKFFFCGRNLIELSSAQSTKPH